MLRKLVGFRLKGVKNISRSRVFLSLTRPVSSDTSVITEEKIGPITAIGINMPEKKNLIDENAYEMLYKALQRLEDDDTSSAALIYGIGGNFCTGCVEGFNPDPRKLIMKNQKPLVAGLTGYATGFGFELALICDLRVMEMTAQIGLNAYPHKMSNFFYERLVSIAGHSVALDLALTGRNLQYREAHQAGIIDRVVDCGTGIGQGIQLAKSIGKFPANELRTVKSVIYSMSSYTIK